MYHSFEQLDVWKRACKLAVQVYEALGECRDFGMRDQMQRSAVSIASNIAEGSERGGKDFSRFLRISLGSAAELRTQLYIARKIGILTAESMKPRVEEAKRISRMLATLRRKIDSDPKEPKTEH